MAREYTGIIKEIIFSSNSNRVKRENILHFHESDIADVLEELTKEERIELYHILGDEIVSEIFAYLDNIEDYIDEISNEKAADIIELMDADDAIDVLEELEEESRMSIEALIEPDVLEDIKLIFQYNEEQIGSKMTNNFIVIQNDNTIKSAMKLVIKQAASNDNVSTIYVEDENHQYYGAVDLRDLIVAREHDDLFKIIKRNYPSFNANELVTDCILELQEYSLDSYPILNDEKEIIGVITHEDVIEELADEMKEDYAMFAGLTDDEELEESVFTSVKKRIPWLVILLFLSLLVSILISRFEGIVSTVPMIVFFQSLILGMAGNTGTQSLAVTIRLLNDDEIKGKQIFQTIFKEIRIGFFNGLLLGILASIFVLLFIIISKVNVISEVFSYVEALEVSIIVGVSLLTAMSMSSVIGALIPILFKKIKIDPAVASGPFITTLNDVLAVMIYYGLATVLFLGL